MAISDLYTIAKLQNNVVVTLKDNDSFSPVAYNFFHGDKKHIFLECVPITYNGNQQLLYLADGAEPLTNVIVNTPERMFGTLVYNVLKAICDFSAYGFLEDECLMTNVNYIYVDIHNLEVKLIYLPLNLTRINIDTGFSAEESIRNILAQYCKLAFPSTNLSRENYRIGMALANRSMSFDELLKYLKNTESVETIERLQTAHISDIPNLILRNHVSGQNIRAGKNGIIIGRQAPTAEGLIKGDREIGRKHCQIVFENDKYYVMDLHSTNGTRLNGMKLVPMKQVEVHPGDQLMIAGEIFECSFERGYNE